MKDILVHEYWQVDVGVVWATVQHSLPCIKAVVLKAIGENGVDITSLRDYNYSISHIL
jgi:uncharacterized protein with HEPN domain